MRTQWMRSRSQRGWGRLLAALVVAVLAVPVTASQADEPGPTVDPVVTAHGGGNDEAGGLLHDERLAIVSARVPEFGSFYVDEDARTLVVHVTERRPRTIADLRHALREAFPANDFPSRIQLVEAEFSFDQLHRWHDRARELFGTMDEVVVMLDLDDRTNLLRIGVSTAAARPELEQRLAQLDIPPEGWTMEQVDPVEPATNVQDRHRPLRGGLQIVNTNGGACTYGLTAIRNGLVGFITNSHCTLTMGFNENTRIAQPFFATDGSNTIGTEFADPPFFTGGACVYPGFRCRYSDSAFVLRDSAHTVSQSVVRNPVGSLAWDGTSRWFVVSERSPVVGESVRKVGRTTGHNTGTVERTCVDFGQSGTNNVMLCQTDTTLNTQPGDSGSPVFRTTSCTVSGVPDTCAVALGLVWGSGGAVSSVTNIQRTEELGPLDLCATDNC